MTASNPEPPSGFPHDPLIPRGHPAQVLEHLVQSDGFELRPRVRTHLLSEGLFLDSDALFERACAWAVATEEGTRIGSTRSAWLDDCVRAAAFDLMQEDREAEERGRPMGGEARFGFFTRTLGITPALSRQAVILLNSASLPERRTFQALLLRRGPLAHHAHSQGRPEAEVLAELRGTLQSLSALGDLPLAGDETHHA